MIDLDDVYHAYDKGFHDGIESERQRIELEMDKKLCEMEEFERSWLSGVRSGLSLAGLPS